MLQEMKVSKKEVVEETPLAEDCKPLFAQEFVRLMTDSAYETLRAYLENIGANPAAVRLLDDLVLSMCWKEIKTHRVVTWIENQAMAEAFGSMSYDISALGGGALLKK